MPILPDDEPVEAQLGKAFSSCGDTGGKHVPDGIAYAFDDLVLIKTYEGEVFLEGPFTTGMRFGMVVRSAEHDLGNAILFLTDLCYAFAGEDGEVERHEGQALAVAFQHQAAGVDGVVDGLIAFWRDIYFGCPRF